MDVALHSRDGLLISYWGGRLEVRFPALRYVSTRKPGVLRSFDKGILIKPNHSEDITSRPTLKFTITMTGIYVVDHFSQKVAQI